MYEGKKKKKEKKKMYYSSYLVMVAVRNLKKKKNADGISFSTAVQIFIHTVLRKRPLFLKSFLFKKRTETERFIPSGIIFHVFTFTIAAQKRQHSK